MKIEEYRGIRGLVAAEVLTDDNETSGGYTTGTPFAVAGVAELTRTTETSSEPHYYDNIPAVVIDGIGSDEVTINASAIPFDVLAKINGQKYDSTSGTYIEGEPEIKYYAIGYITEKTDGTEVFVWRLKGKFSIPDSTHATKNDGTDANGQELVYTGISTTHKFTETGKVARAVHTDTTINSTVTESTFFASVQTPDTLL